MSIDVESRVRTANPLTRDEQLDRLYGDDVSRRLRRDIYARTEGRMTETNHQQIPEETREDGFAAPPERPSPLQPRRPRLVLVAAAAAALVAAGVVIAIATSGGDPTPPATEPPQPAPTEAPQPAPTEAPQPTQAPEPPAPVPPTPAELAALGERFVDAYLAADLDAVRAAAPGAELGAVPYLIGWNPAANYEVVERKPCIAAAGNVSCTIVGSDDVFNSLGVGFTDIFTLIRRDGQIRSVQWSVAWSDEQLAQDFEGWLRDTQPALFTVGGACEGFLAGGPTPGDCARAWAEAVGAYKRAGVESVGEEFVDAYLSLDPDRVAALARPSADLSLITYLQGWNRPANYEVLERFPCTASGSTVTCVVAGTDDFGNALGITFTDTFEVRVLDGVIMTVDWSMQADPDAVLTNYEEWLRETEPDLFAAGGACERFFQGGPTPGDCYLAWLARVDDFKAAETG